MQGMFGSHRAGVHQSPPSSPSNAQQQQGAPASPSNRSQQTPRSRRDSPPATSQRSPPRDERPHLSRDANYYERRQQQSRYEPEDEGANSSRQRGDKAYLSRFGRDDEPLVGENTEWVRKSSRQRRFTHSTLPVLHQREAIAREEEDFDDTERSQVLGDMSEQMVDMSGYVSNFVQRKEEDLKFMAEMFDEDGNPIMRYDEDGNPIPFRDEDGHSMDGWDRYEEDTKQANQVTIDTAKMSIKEGWLWKKGSGNGLLSRKNWVKRYFKFDMFQVITIYYFKNAMPNASEQRQAESKEMYQKRKRAFFNEQKQYARGYVKLMYASLEIPHRRSHKNPMINSDWVFQVVIPNSRTFVLAAESQEEYDKWTQTIGYITGTIQKARQSMTKKRPPRAIYDEGKRDAALCITAFGKGLFEAVAGHPIEFFIQGYDFQQGVPASEGGLKLTAVMESRDLHYDLTVVDLQDGTYSVSYTPTRVGTYELSIMLDDYDIKGSPFHPTVRPAPVSAPHCVADGAGLFCAVVGAVNRFTIHTRNAFNQIVVAKAVPFEVYMNPPLFICHPDGSRIDPNVEWHPQDMGNGTYSVTYLVDPAPQVMEKLSRGDHMEGEIFVMLNDHIHTPSFSRSIKGGPFHPVLAASATGAALASAARHAALLLGNAAYEDMMSSYSLSSQQQPPPRQLMDQPPRQQHPQQFVDDGSDEDESSFHLKEVPRRIQPQNNNIDKRRFEDSFSSSALYNNEPSFMNSKAIPSEYLPVRRPRPEADQQQPDEIRSFKARANNQTLTVEQRQALDAEREQLMRLRRELHEGRHLVDEQVERMAMATRRAQEDSQRMLVRSGGDAEEKSSFYEPPPPPPPYQYVRATERSATGSPYSNTRSQPILPSSAASRQPQHQSQQYQASPSRMPPKGPPATAASASLPPSRAFDSAVMALFNKHVQPLKRVFRHFSTRDEISGFDAVRLTGFVRCCTEFDVSPTFASKKEVRDAFETAAAGGDVLDFPSFVDALGHVAVSALGKPMFANLYPTPQSRVSVMLGMWGLGDPATFEAVIQREKYARGAM